MPEVVPKLPTFTQIPVGNLQELKHRGIETTEKSFEIKTSHPCLSYQTKPTAEATVIGHRPVQSQS